MTDKGLLFMIFIGGALEFVGAQAAVISFNGALSAGMNGGIVGAIIAVNTVYVLFAAYCLFGESLNKVKLLAIILLVSSVILISLFPPEGLGNSMPDVASTGEDSTLKNLLS